MRVAAVQMRSAASRQENVKQAMVHMDKAAAAGAELVVLPEYMTFLGPYRDFRENSESIPGPTSESLAAKAQQHGIYIHSGSLIEQSSQSDRLYNTSILFGPDGEQIAAYRKIHRFEVNVPGVVRDNESRTISPGEEVVVVALPEITLGLSICFDLRFPEMYRQMAAAGAEVFLVPAAFARATGRVHWEILLRARAIENLAYVVAVAQHGQDLTGAWRYGRSMVVAPWGEVLAAAPEMGDEILLVDIDRRKVARRRKQMPVLALRQPSVYQRLKIYDVSHRIPMSEEEK